MFITKMLFKPRFSAKFRKISSQFQLDNKVGLSSTTIESDAFEELAELVQTLGGETSILKVLFDSS